jgi:phosphatidylglycerophosphatase A
MASTTSVNPSFRQLLRDPLSFMAFGLGSGLAPKMPGTAGTLVAVPLYWLAAPYLSLAQYGLALVLTFVIGIYVCDHATRKLGVHDHGGIVWDEWVGYWVTMMGAPLHWQWALVGFLLFRFFDMVKPWPIHLADRKIHGGFGIMFDDLLAGIAAATCLQGMIYFHLL